MKTWQQLAISVGLGIGIGGVVGYLTKQHYEDLFYKELDVIDQDRRKSESDLIDRCNFACREIFELREALRIMVDEMQYETILEQVKYKMREMDEKYPQYRKYVDRYRIKDEFSSKSDNTCKQATKMATDLGYSLERPVIHTLTLEDKDYLDRAEKDRRRALAMQKAIVEEALAQAEHPMDDGEEFMDGPRLAPNGDILDDGWDPSDEMDDDMPMGECFIGCEGDTTIRDEPYLITEFQFIYGKRDYTKCSVSYLSKDDTVLDEDDTELDQKYVGPDNLKAFEETDCPSIFVRNDQIEIDYEIMWEDMSYIHDRLGYPESEVSGQRIWRKWDKEE